MFALYVILCFTGPMVYATCYCPVSKKNIVNELGFAGMLSVLS